MARFLYAGRMRVIILMLLTLIGWPAMAQDRPPQGIGFAQAEEGTWLCRHDQPEEALSCAREQCAEQAPGQECWATAWCFPANWSGVMTVWLPDFHTTQILCGAPSEQALNNALAAICAGDENATHCDLTLLVDPEGNEGTAEGQSFPGGAAPPPPDPGLPASGEADSPAPASPEPAENEPASEEPAAGP